MPPTVFVPLLSEHKTVFVWNRFFETLLGGLRIFLNSSSDVPVFVYLVQLLVHQTPFFLGALFTMLAETQVLTTSGAAICCGATATVTAACVQTFSFWLQRDHVSQMTAEVPNSPSKRVPGCLVEDEVVEFESCCSLATVRLLFPNKRFLVNAVVHALLWGTLTGYGVVYLSPTWLVHLYGSSGVAYTVFFLGWMSACISLYSLVVHVPAEPATFHPLDRWEIRSLNRPFYVALFYGLDVFYRATEARHEAATVGHIVFVVLPLLWFLNLLPPLDALLLWAAEMVLVWLGGGSPTASTKRLFFHLLFWALTVTIVYFISFEDGYSILVSAVLGYTLSLDIGEALRIAATSNRAPVAESDQNCESVRWICRDAVFFSLVFLATVAVSVGLHVGLQQNEPSVNPKVCLGYLLLVSLILTVVMSNLQSVYLFFGFVRNVIYPPDTRNEIRFARKLFAIRHLGIIRCIMTSLVTPMLLMAYVFILEVEFKIKNQDSSTRMSLFHVIACLRAFRWSWQQTDSALLEIVVVHFASVYVAEVSLALDDAVVLLLVTAFLHDRLIDFLAKLQVVFSILIPSVTQDKQRRSYSWYLFAVNVVCFPEVLAVLVISSLLSAPLLPLFTLPIFWIGFPRPTHFWPKQEDILSGSSPDSIYYEEIIGKLAKEFGGMVARGSVGGVRPGDHFLLRYDDRLAFLSVSESGYGYIVARIKGLELQQTSCHAVEASAVDHLLEVAFERDAATYKRCPTSVSFGPGCLHVYRPCDVALVETYVDTRNVLTGVINSPETLQLLSDCFGKCLIWVLIPHFGGDATEGLENGDDVRSLKIERTSVRSRPSTADKYAQLPRAPSIYQFLESFTNSVSSDPDPWKDDEDPLGVAECPPPRSSWTRSAAGRVSVDGTMESIPTLPEIEADPPGVVTEPDVVSTKSAWPWDPGLEASNGVTTDQERTGTGSTLIESSKNAANFPEDWLKSPVPEDHILFSEQHFPNDWFNFVCNRFSIGEREIAKLAAVYRPLVLSCHVIVNQVRTTGRRMSIGPCNVARSFNGDLPWSPYSDWLMDNADLHDFVVKAYRYACKVALDQTLLGETESDAEFADYLEDYDSSWHLGCDTEPSWIEAVQRRIPNLFCMGYNPVTWTHTSHLLTRRTVPVYVGRLNREMVRSVWSTLSLELLYLTNDDEERYSIQAHPGILRNLTVQGADPPLGYPVYVSEPLLIKTTPGDVFGQRSGRISAMTTTS